MNNNQFDRRLVDNIKESYPPGTRVILNHMEDTAPIESGTRGSVDHVDDMGQIHMRWDNGRGLALVPGEDDFRKLTPEEAEAENTSLADSQDLSAMSM